MKEVLIVQGPGFYDQGDVIHQIQQDKSVNLKILNIGSGTSDIDPTSAVTADFVLLRGPWSATPEEKLYSSLLAARLKVFLHILEKRVLANEKLRIVGIGRGAMMLLQAGFAGLHQLRDSKWENDFQDQGPWVSVKANGTQLSLFGLIQGRTIPRPDRSTISGLHAWLTLSNGKNVGWQMGSSVNVTFLDVLALADRAQLQDYGYVDLVAVPTQQDVLSWMLSGKVFADKL